MLVTLQRAKDFGLQRHEIKPLAVVVRALVAHGGALARDSIVYKLLDKKVPRAYSVERRLQRQQIGKVGVGLHYAPRRVFGRALYACQPTCWLCVSLLLLPPRST